MMKNRKHVTKNLKKGSHGNMLYVMFTRAEKIDIDLKFEYKNQEFTDSEKVAYFVIEGLFLHKPAFINRHLFLLQREDKIDLYYHVDKKWHKDIGYMVLKQWVNNIEPDLADQNKVTFSDRVINEFIRCCFDKKNIIPVRQLSLI